MVVRTMSRRSGSEQSSVIVRTFPLHRFLLLVERRCVRFEGDALSVGARRQSFKSSFARPNLAPASRPRFLSVTTLAGLSGTGLEVDKIRIYGEILLSSPESSSLSYSLTCWCAGWRGSVLVARACHQPNQYLVKLSRRSRNVREKR